MTVQPQTKPIELELPGRTDYDPNTLNKIRPRFDTLVERVHAELGQKVKKGDPLVDLFSTDLAAAKNDFQTAYVQWQHDLTLRNLREELIKTNAISKQVLVDTRNDENKSRLTLSTARQKLKVFEVPEDQIDRVDQEPRPRQGPLGRSDGRRRRQGEDDAPLSGGRHRDHPRRGPGQPLRQQRRPDGHRPAGPPLRLGERLRGRPGQGEDRTGDGDPIPLPERDGPRQGAVRRAEVSKDTRAIQIRATVPNVDGKLKSNILVRAGLDVPPVPGWTVIPRLAMVVMNGDEYAFVQNEAADSKGVEKFERRKLEIAEERDDHVVVSKGLRPGERVASNGSLILAQLYEDQQMVATGLPLK